MNRLIAAQEKLQGLGRSLMLPIAVLPVAALMLRLGQPDLLDQAFIAASGSAIFANLGLLFAIGVGVGLAKENNGAAGLAGAVAFLVLMQSVKALIDVPDTVTGLGDPAVREAVVSAWKESELSQLSVPAGILCGLMSGFLYNRYHAIRLPEYLSFFGGRRFVPIAAGLFGLIAGAMFGFTFPILVAGVDQLSAWVTATGSLGLFLYGLLNRLLIVTGLHHILNNIAWFVLGEYNGVTGDLNRFFAGDHSAGFFMAGFFPVMMFGLPAACLAMWQTVPTGRKKAMGGMYLSMALTSFLTGVTEPIEFTFMFVAPLLFLLHAILTGLSMVIMNLFDVRLGFGFSAGLFDYVLNYHLATNSIALLPIGAGYFIVYYGSFRFAISKFGIAVPGSEAEDAEPEGEESTSRKNRTSGELGVAYIDALGGTENLVTVDACTTRLRLTVRSSSAANEAALRKLGAKGVLKISEVALQVVIGPDADRIAGEIRNSLINDGSSEESGFKEKIVHGHEEADPLQTADAMYLGGSSNIIWRQRSGRRSVFKVADMQVVRADLLHKDFPDQWFETPGGTIHIIAA